MALIEIHDSFRRDLQLMDALEDHFGKLKELRYLRHPDHQTRTYFVESDNFKPSEQICPTIAHENGKVKVISENYVYKEG
jgi:hypothetical protein